MKEVYMIRYPLTKLEAEKIHLVIDVEN